MNVFTVVVATIVLSLLHLSSLPVNKGVPLTISAKIQPILHISTGVEYFLEPNSTSGARYLVTLLVMKQYQRKEQHECDGSESCSIRVSKRE